MKPSVAVRESRRDVSEARRAIERMGQATKFPELLAGWEDYLFRLQRAWERVSRTLRPLPGGQQWLDIYDRLRREDPLLYFLKEARNAETHAVAPTLEQPLQLLFKDRWGRAFRIDHIRQSLQDGVLTIDVNTDQRQLD